MSAAEIAELTAEAQASQAAAEAAEQAPEPENQLVLPPVDPGFSAVMGKVIYALAAPICRKANVTGLEQEEADAIGASLALLIEVYDVGPKDPKGAAWLGLALTVVGVLGNRRKLAPLPEEEPPPPPGFGTVTSQSSPLPA